MGGRLAGMSIRLSWTKARNAASGGSAQGSKASGSVRALRLISACVPQARHTTSGSRPMIE
jgi:hypothetical protein